MIVCLALMLGMILPAASLAACGKDDSTRVVFTTGFGKNEVFRIGDESCTRAEMMVYLTTVQNQYEQVYGDEIWETELDGVTLEENVKDTVLARIAQVKTMYLLALEKEIALDETEEALVQQAAQQYYDSLNETELGALEVTTELLQQMYREYALADKVYDTIISDVNPEISDDEARTITVQYIMLKNYTNDGSGKRVDYTDSVLEATYEKACEVRELAAAGETDFAELASKYSEDTTITVSFGKGEREEAFETAAFNLETDEISEVVEGADGYYIIKCISTFDREETDANKVKLLEQRKNEAFGQEYDAFVEGLVRNLNDDLWEEMTLLHDENVTTSNFFEVYEELFDAV